MPAGQAGQKALGLLSGIVQQQSTMLATIDIFQGYMLMCLVAAALVWVLKKVSGGKAPAGAH
jgi:hypothetical protein